MAFLDHYTLENGIPVKCDDLKKWVQFMRSEEKFHLTSRIGDTLVSTVFLGKDQRAAFWGDPPGPPILFETMIFSLDDEAIDQSEWRYLTLTEAKEHHARLVAALEAGTSIDDTV